MRAHVQRVALSAALLAFSGAAAGDPCENVVCDDGSPCTDDTCDPGNGACIHVLSGACDVPLKLWRDASFPGGLNLGTTMGVSWGDYDADGSIDLFVAYSGVLWRNVGGTTWDFADNLSTLIPPTERRYGSSFGDYDNDGLPDIAIAPRVPLFGDDRFHLLHNLGGGPNFVDVASDPALVDVQPYGNAETLCWADFDGDSNLDLFVPVYPGSLGPGNFFLHNLGPTGPQGAHRFAERSGPAGLDNPPGTARPEGAQAADVDSDGDIDLFSNGTLYQNRSSPQVPLFTPLSESASGIGLPGSLEEGTVFFDYDMDGDQDLVAAYVVDGVRIWENRGDGTFFAAEATIVDSPSTGLGEGISAEDWDNDGDVDFTTRQVFRRNRFLEEQARHFTVASHGIPPEHIHSANPAWGDWDRDGDLDCAVGNWGDDGHLYENALYTPATPAQERRYVRVRAVRDAPGIPRGLETEYGATVQIRVVGDPSTLRREKFVSSSAGYLNQNEYTLHFALPPRPAPPADEIRFGVVVDFPSLPGELRRIDRHVNPVLGNLGLASLTDREIEVDRSGRVVIGGVVHDPNPLASPVLTTTTGGLALPGNVPLPAPVPAPEPNWFVGLAFDTRSATGTIAIEEILLDGQLAAGVACLAGNRNATLWDVTNPSQPALVSSWRFLEPTSARNRRSYFPVDIVLQPGRDYRLVARVLELRGSPIDAPVASGPITVRGGLSFRDANPCTGQRVASASLITTEVPLAFRFRPIPPGACQAGDPVACDDGNACTDDTCGPSGACAHTANSASCDDGSLCTAGDACSSGTCLGTGIDCNDSNSCTTDGCDSASGCTHANNTAACDDGDACTTNDACADGGCHGGALFPCSDGNPCTDDTCVSGIGCVSTQDDTNPCSDAQPCTQQDRCIDGACAGVPIACEDGDPCTTDACVTAHGCIHTLLEVTGLDWAGRQTLIWEPKGALATYDVARGALDELSVLGSGASEVCIASDIADATTAASDAPASRSTFWYLVRAEDPACGTGTYGFGYSVLAPPPERSVSVCP